TAAPVVPAPSTLTTCFTVTGMARSPASNTSRWPAVACNADAPSTFRNTSPGASCASEIAAPDVVFMGARPAATDGSGAKMVTRGSFCWLVWSWAASVSTMAAPTPSTEPEARAAPATAMAASSENQRTPVPPALLAVPALAACPVDTAPLTVTRSSVPPSVSITDRRTVRLMVSPVVRAEQMMAVPSMSPATIRLLRAGRRRMLRTPIRKNTRWRTARRPITAVAAAMVAASATVSPPMGSPKTRSTAGRSRHRGRCLGHEDFVVAPPRRRSEQRAEVAQHRRVPTATVHLGRRVLGRPQADEHGLPLGRAHDVDAAVARLLPEGGEDVRPEELERLVHARAQGVDLKLRDSCVHAAPPAPIRRPPVRRASARCGRLGAPRRCHA